jgi:hypothetical protein
MLAILPQLLHVLVEPMRIGDAAFAKLDFVLLRWSRVLRVVSRLDWLPRHRSMPKTEPHGSMAALI